MSREVEFTKMPRANYDLSSPEDLDFLMTWLRVLFVHDMSLQGKINSYTIPLTGKYLAIDQSGQISVCEVEK